MKNIAFAGILLLATSAFAQEAAKPATPAPAANPQPTTEQALHIRILFDQIAITSEHADTLKAQAESALKDAQIAQDALAQYVGEVKKLNGWGDDVTFDYRDYPKALFVRTPAKVQPAKPEPAKAAAPSTPAAPVAPVASAKK